MEKEAPFTIRRVARPGSSNRDLPMIVRCIWDELKVENMSIFVSRAEDLTTVRGCPYHADCKGHYMINPNGDVYMIPYGFASGDELRYSDAAALNIAIHDGLKTASEVAEYCWGRIKGKNGILRRNCNSAKPTNTTRFVGSALDQDIDESLGIISLPKDVFTKGKFLFLNKDGTYITRKMKEGDMLILGRQPSQGALSALPMKVKMSTDDASTVRVPLETCKMNNTDFDGDELWQHQGMSSDANEEMKKAWDRVWNTNTIVPIKKTVYEMMTRAGGRTDIDPVMYSTMPLEDMIDHPGGELYDILMLKPKSWKVMGQTSFNPSYWRTWIERSMDGINNSTLGKHGIGKPYVAMRNAMMMGTMVTRNKSHVRITAKGTNLLPAMIAPPAMNYATCASGLTKLTSTMYQKGIDIAKHGNDMNKITAVETLMKMGDNCFGIVVKDSVLTLSLMKVEDAYKTGLPYTKMDYIAGASTPENLLERSIEVVSMVEELDDVKLTNEERLMVATFFGFASKNVSEIVSDNMVGVMTGLQADWYTSITCSNITWLTRMLRSPPYGTYVDMSTDISSILGAIFLGNMSIFAPFGPSED